MGTASSRSVEDARVGRLLSWGDGLWERRASRSLLERLRQRRAAQERSSDPEPAGTYAVHAIGKVRDDCHAAALALVEELIAMGSSLDALPLTGGGKASHEGRPGSPLGSGGRP